MNRTETINDEQRNQYRRNGFVVIDEFAPVDNLLDSAETLAAKHSLPKVERAMPGRSLSYRVMDGHFVHAHMPELVSMGENILAKISRLDSRPLHRLSNRAAAVNINITDPGGEYRWHYDRNAVTTILYLNAVEGGATELLPNNRWHLGPLKATPLQRYLDNLQIQRAQRSSQASSRSDSLQKIQPQAGRLLVMRGDRCLHSVLAVSGSAARYNVIYTYDRQGARFVVEKDLDTYLYSTKTGYSHDPNYVA